MTTPRTATLAALGVAGIAAAALATGSLLVGSAPASVDGTAQSAHPSQVQLACPTALVDPFNTSNVATVATWSSLSSAPITPAPASITGTGGVIPTGLTLVGQGGGELAGLSAVGCAAPAPPSGSRWVRPRRVLTWSSSCPIPARRLRSSVSMATGRSGRSMRLHVR